MQSSCRVRERHGLGRPESGRRAVTEDRSRLRSESDAAFGHQRNDTESSASQDIESYFLASTINYPSP